MCVKGFLPGPGSGITQHHAPVGDISPLIKIKRQYLHWPAQLQANAYALAAIAVVKTTTVCMLLEHVLETTDAILPEEKIAQQQNVTSTYTTPCIIYASRTM